MGPHVLWWGYKHQNGSLLLKRLLSNEDIPEARESSFVVQVYGPFEAETHETATAELRRLASQVDN